MIHRLAPWVRIHKRQVDGFSAQVAVCSVSIHKQRNESGQIGRSRTSSACRGTAVLAPPARPACGHVNGVPTLNAGHRPGAWAKMRGRRTCPSAVAPSPVARRELVSAVQAMLEVARNPRLVLIEWRAVALDPAPVGRAPSVLAACFFAPGHSALLRLEWPQVGSAGIPQADVVSVADVLGVHRLAAFVDATCRLVHAVTLIQWLPCPRTMPVVAGVLSLYSTLSCGYM